MRILLEQQTPVIETERIIYTFKDNIITANLNDTEEVFDFTGVPDGRLDLTGPDPIETKLGINPILSAEVIDGILYVRLLNYTALNATKKERFPEWIDASEYVIPEIPEEEEVEVEDTAPPQTGKGGFISRQKEANIDEDERPMDE